MTAPEIPAGWDAMGNITWGGTYTCYRRRLWTLGGERVEVYAVAAWIEVGDARLSPDEARALAASIIEAADITERLRSGPGQPQ